MKLKTPIGYIEALELVCYDSAHYVTTAERFGTHVYVVYRTEDDDTGNEFINRAREEAGRSFAELFTKYNIDASESFIPEEFKS